MDETPTVWGINPKFLFQTVNSGGRAAAPESDERARITTNVCVCADGSSLPPSFIIKCSTDATDQSRLQVLNTLLTDPEFNTDGRWAKGTWTRTMSVKKKARRTAQSGVRLSTLITQQYRCRAQRKVRWLIKSSFANTCTTLTVALCGLTRQESFDGIRCYYHLHLLSEPPNGTANAAYQDTPGLEMWCDLVMGPARVRSGRQRWLLVWDNSKAHDVKSVISVFNSWGISVRFLPKNMTDYLQPVDLVPNGPIKAHIRRERCAQLYEYFQLWRLEAKEAEEARAPLPVYLPPPSTMARGIALISSIFKGRFTEEDYMQGIRRCFVAVGLAPKSDGSFVVYTDHKRGQARASAFRGVSSVKDMPGAPLLDDVEFEDRPDSGETESGEADVVDIEPEPLAVPKAMADGPT